MHGAQDVAVFPPAAAPALRPIPAAALEDVVYSADPLLGPAAGDAVLQVVAPVALRSAAETLRTAPSAPGLLREALRALWCAPVCSGVLRGGDGCAPGGSGLLRMRSGCAPSTLR